MEITKPGHGAPCNGCGKCCSHDLCPLALALFQGERRRPCPALEWDAENRAVCGLIVHPTAYVARDPENAPILSAAAALLVGAGQGCDMLMVGERPNRKWQRRIAAGAKRNAERIMTAMGIFGVTARLWT
jgi:hypothetical protein